MRSETLGKVKHNRMQREEEEEDTRTQALKQPPWTVTIGDSKQGGFYLKPSKKPLENFKQRSSMN